MANYITTDTDLTSVANAIREKGGTSAPLEWPQGYIDAVEDISTQPVSVPSKDVDFYDYDGIRVYSYTAMEFLALEEMPANPDHSHDEVPLTAQGWNWSFSDAQTYVQDYGMLDVGQMYVPTDGKTHILITIPVGTPSNRMTFYIRFKQSVSRGVTVDWGDGNTQTYTGTTETTHDHTYAQIGRYDITLKATSGTITLGGSVSNNYNMFGSATDADIYNSERVEAIYFGSDITGITENAMRFCFRLGKLTMSKAVITMGENALNRCHSLACVIMPDSLTSIAQNQYGNNTNSAHRVITAGTTPIAVGYTWSVSFERIFVPAGITAIGDSAYRANDKAQVAIIPQGVVSIGESAFTYCYSLTFLDIPLSVSEIKASAFSSCKGLSAVHLRSSTPPTLANANAFANIPSDCIIYVPHGKLNTYKTATNWSTYASHMQEEPS